MSPATAGGAFSYNKIAGLECLVDKQTATTTEAAGLDRCVGKVIRSIDPWLAEQGRLDGGNAVPTLPLLAKSVFNPCE